MPWITVNSEPPKPPTFEDLGYVQVVRCKDCKFRDKEIVPDGAWEGYVFCKKDCAGHKDDWFCADGERRTE